MTMSAPQSEDEKGRVLPFRRRERPRPKETGEPVDGLGKFAARDEPDDYRQRMTNNALALGACVLLVAIGIWIANTMAEMRKNQDCVLSGRRDCAKIVAPSADPKR
jgi:hypothetical protein